MSAITTEQYFSTAGSPHAGEFYAALQAKAKSTHYINPNVYGVVTAGNTCVKPDGDIVSGALYHAKGDMPLTLVHSLTGGATYSRTGVYLLSGEPTLNTLKKFAKHMTKEKIPQMLRQSEEEYGPYEVLAPLGEPWVAQIDNGAASRNFIMLAHNTTHGGSKWALIVHSNAEPQGRAAIAAMLKQMPAATVGDYLRSDMHTRVSEMSDMQNKRIAADFANLCGFAALMDLRHDVTMRTSADEYAAPVQYAEPHSMMRFGQPHICSDGSVRLTNAVYDRVDLHGTDVPLVLGIADGFVLARPLPKPARSTLHRCVAAFPRENATPMHFSADDLERFGERIHCAERTEAITSMINTRVASVDPAHATFSPAALAAAGLSTEGADRYKSIGCVVFP